MKVYVAIDNDIEHSTVLGVYRTYEAALREPGCNSVEVFVLDDAPEPGDDAPEPCRFVRGIYGRTSQEYLCSACGDTESKHAPTAFAPFYPVAENQRIE